MKNKKEIEIIEDWQEAEDWFDSLYDTDREKYFMISFIVDSRKKKWKAEMMEIVGEDEEVSPHLTIGQDGFVKGRNQLRQQLREKIEKL